MFKQPSGKLRILKVKTEVLGDISDEDVKKEGYRSREGLIAAWVGLHKRWIPKTLVTVYDFKPVKPNSNGKAQVRLNGKKAAF